MEQRPKILLALALSTLLLSMGGRAAAQREIPRISIHELKGMMDQGASVLILDTHPKVVFEKGHIKGAISFPWKPTITQQDASGLPRDKLIVTYCSCGEGEGDSASVAEQLRDFGFRNVKVLSDPSVRGWKEAGYPME